MSVSVIMMDDGTELQFYHVCVMSMSELIPHERVHVSNNDG